METSLEDGGCEDSTNCQNVILDSELVSNVSSSRMVIWLKLVSHISNSRSTQLITGLKTMKLSEDVNKDLKETWK